MTRTRSVKRPRPAAPAAAVEAPPAWLEWPVHAATYAQRFIDQLQRTERRTLHEMSRDADLACAEARTASPGGALGLDFEFAAEQCARATQAWAQVLGAWFDAQSAWWKDAEACTAEALRPWLAGEPQATSAQTLLEPPGDPTPAGLLRAAHAGWTGIGQAWLNALGHDLRSSPAA